MNELSQNSSKTPSSTQHTMKINQNLVSISLETDKIYEFPMNYDQLSLIRKFAQCLDNESSEVEIPNISAFSIYFICDFVIKYHHLTPSHPKPANISTHTYLGNDIYHHLMMIPTPKLMKLWHDSHFLGYHKLFYLLPFIMNNQLNINNLIKLI